MGRGRPKRSLEAKLDALPPIIDRRGWLAADFRAWGRGRVTLRDPEAVGWPRAGARTADLEVALTWLLRGYLPRFREDLRREQLQLPRLPRRLGPAIETWVGKLRSLDVPTATWHNYRAAVNHLVDAFGEDYSTDRLTTPVLQALIDELQVEGYAPNSLIGIRLGIAKFIHWVERGEIAGKKRKKLPPNAAHAVQLPDVPQVEVHPWTEEQRAALRTAASELDREDEEFQHHRRAVELGLALGGRRNELFAIQWSQVNKSAYTARFTHQLAKDRRELVPLKSKLFRTALLLPSWWEHHLDGQTGPVLPAPNGEFMHPRLLHRVRLRLLEKAKLWEPGIGYHKDRHTYSFDFLVEGGRLEELQKSLGHASIVTTEKVYGHFHDDVAAALARRRIYREEPLRVVRF